MINPAHCPGLGTCNTLVMFSVSSILLAFSQLVPHYHTSSNDHPLSSNIRDFTALPRSTLVLHGLVKDCVNFSFVESATMVEGQTAHFCYFISPVVIFKCVCRLDRAAKINQSRGFAGVQKGKGFMCRDVISRVNLFDSRLRNSAGSLCSAEGSAW